jgi:hypothetical protein
MAKALGSIGETVIQNWSLGGGLAMDYSDLVNNGFQKIAEHFGLDVSVDDQAAIEHMRRANAKYPDQRFSGDDVKRQSLISTALRSACDTHLQPVHRQLLALAAKG